MKTLANERDRNEIFARLNDLRPDAPRQWGVMTVHQMLCHLGDSYKITFAERGNPQPTTVLNTTAIKWMALWLPIPWPKGVKTMPNVDQLIGGTPPMEFERDRRELRETIERFLREMPAIHLRHHPIFGALTDREWLRWGWQHADHHFRQFGA